MEQHPIPQHISSYEFKLVGEMTLKQFLKAAGGIILALLINSTKMVFFIKWPLMLTFGIGGLALAFHAIQAFDQAWTERPPYTTAYHYARFLSHLAKNRTADHAAFVTQLGGAA